MTRAFPRGKLEPGEARATGLARELREELGIPSAIHVPSSACDSGEPRGLDGQAFRWLSQDELEAAELLPADGPIVRALRLPERLTHPATPDYKVVESTFSRKRLAVDEDARTARISWFCAMSLRMVNLPRYATGFRCRCLRVESGSSRRGRWAPAVATRLAGDGFISAGG